MNTDTYIISLDRPDKLIEYTRDFNLNPIWVEGVNGKKITKSEIEKHNSKLWSNIGPKGAIGCGMSHLLCWGKIANADKDYALILEDDVYFSDDFEEQFTNAISHVPSDFDILYLGCYGCEKNSFQSKLFSLIGRHNRMYKDINDYIEVPKITLATHAYVVSKRGAKKLIELLDGNISFHIDQVLQSLSRKNKIKIYAVKKKIGFQTSCVKDSVSVNVSTEHPMIINRPLSYVQVDNDMSMKYMLNISLASIGGVNVTAMSFLFLATGIVLAYNNIDVKKIIISFLLLSIPDFVYKISDMSQIIFHLFLLISPFSVSCIKKI
jgi:GR25 family glycosyltransferase involved in LPS biosynthesis